MPAADRFERRASERGQALPFLLVWIVLALALIGMTLAIGQAASRRMALQVLADAGAYTGASTMAVGMNALAKVNRELIDLWEQSSPLFTTGVPCSVSDDAVVVYEQLAADLGSTYEQLNSNWQFQPEAEARRVTAFNLYDLFPGEPQRRFGLAEIDPGMRLALQRDDDVLVRSTRDYEPLNWACSRGYYLEPRHYRFARAYRKADGDVKSFVWVVRSRAGTALLASTLFGSLAIPPMTAAAAAKPVGGSIERGAAAYVAKMIPLENVGVRTVRDGVPRASRRVTH